MSTVIERYDAGPLVVYLADNGEIRLDGQRKRLMRIDPDNASKPIAILVLQQLIEDHNLMCFIERHWRDGFVLEKNDSARAALLEALDRESQAGGAA